MTVLVVGATGATGRLLVAQLLQRGEKVRAVVRNSQTLPRPEKYGENLTVIQASLLELTHDALADAVDGCDAVASCLGHNLHFRGIWGEPRFLVTEAVRRLCQAAKTRQTAQPVKFVLMGTAGYCSLPSEQISVPERVVMAAVRAMVPPHRDNEQAADFLRTQILPNDALVQWVTVRPDTLINRPRVGEYTAFPSPLRSALFNPGKTSRIQVAHFMAELITNEELWARWKGKLPVLYDNSSVPVPGR